MSTVTIGWSRPWFSKSSCEWALNIPSRIRSPQSPGGWREICGFYSSCVLARSAVVLRREKGKETMNATLLVIDPQNDFCDIEGAALPVPGADADLKRLSSLIAKHTQSLSDIVVTLDSHATVSIERTTFWKQEDGRPGGRLHRDHGAVRPRRAVRTPRSVPAT